MIYTGFSPFFASVITVIYLQIINSNSVGLEIMQGFSGIVGIVLTVPATVLLASFVLTHKMCH